MQQVHPDIRKYSRRLRICYGVIALGVIAFATDVLLQVGGWLGVGLYLGGILAVCLGAMAAAVCSVDLQRARGEHKTLSAD